MDDVSSLACPMTAGTASVAMARDASRSLLRWVILGMAGTALLILALMQSASVGAAAPTTYGNGGCIYNTVCGATNTGIPANAAVTAPYFDNRYGFVQVVTDSSGNLIDVNPATGQRIFPFLPDFGFGGVIGNGFIGANFVNGGFIAPGTANGITCNGLYGCPFGGGFIGNGFNGGFVNANFVNNGGFNGGFVNNGFFNNGGFFNNNGAFPAGATNIGGGVFTYNDNRFCGDGKLFFVVGRGSFCQNGGNGVFNGNGAFINANFRGFEATTSTPQQASTVTTYAAAAPKAAAPVVAQAAAPVVQAAVAPQAAAPVVQAAVAPKAPVTAPAMAAPIVAKAQATTPVVTNGTADSDDHRG